MSVRVGSRRHPVRAWRQPVGLSARARALSPPRLAMRWAASTLSASERTIGALANRDRGLHLASELASAQLGKRPPAIREASARVSVA